MIRMLLVAVAATLIAGSGAMAQVKQADVKGKGGSKTLSVAAYGEAKPSSCPGCDGGGTPLPPGYVPGSRFAGRSGAYNYGLSGHQAAMDRHECAPNGCPTPVGCGNFWTELKFIFGSCRQFYGTGESTIYHHRNTRYRD